MGLPTGPWLLGPEEAIVQAALVREVTTRFGATVAPGYREKISARTAMNSAICITPTLDAAMLSLLGVLERGAVRGQE
jgi:hypothetical protein